jgi:hypothetical protein
MGMVPYPGVDNRIVWQELLRGLKLTKPAECPGPIYDLMTLCTHHTPDKRPTFRQICTRLVCDTFAVCVC